ncbi:MAG: response regulator [Phaeospirillum sp.]|nr:response regulator [Phaeospirillum sp.]
MAVDVPFVVAIIDDDAGFRDAIGWLLRTNGYEVHCYADAASFIEQHDIKAIGCTLLDLRLDQDCGIKAFQRSREHGHDAPVMMISGHGDIPTAVQAVQLGAAGFIEKPIDSGKLLATVAAACSAHRQQCDRYGRAATALNAYGRLTSREREAFWLMVDGLTTKEIAAAMTISVRTAECHRAQVFGKMSVGSLAEIHNAARFLLRQTVNP